MMIIIETRNVDILTDYFTGRYKAYLDYINSVDEPVNDKKRFVLDVMSRLDPFVSKMKPELLNIYVDKYTAHRPFTAYSSLVPQVVMNSINKNMNRLVKDIKRPEITYKAK
ncbi:hypothetical protein KIJ04_08085 [Leuconostoc gelidum subsp. gelidum]|uniref:hypothetical protein n=1 Tax=Leuconostoc gelidum TaxID=1244 RepID=UPI001CC6B4EF|nr:hypothetical protein [Leuconostoc gelidum]MBZ6014693.1 hypothetical protein [Leuconostoc gelidum subsp. gelidum]